MSYVLLQDAGGILASPGWHCSGDSSPSGCLASNVFFFLHISIYILYIFILASNLLKDILLKISIGPSNHFPNFEILRCGEGMGVRIKP